VKSNEWEIIEHPAIKHTVYKIRGQEPHPHLTFYLKIKRVAAFYTYILVVPCLLLSFLTLVIFWLPPESPAKMILGDVIFSSSVRSLSRLAVFFPARRYASAEYAVVVCPSVRRSIFLSVTNQCSIKTAKHMITQTMSYDSTRTRVLLLPKILAKF